MGSDRRRWNIRLCSWFQFKTSQGTNRLSFRRLYKRIGGKKKMRNGFLTTYRKIKGIWKRPKFRVFFGLWKNDTSMLPVCRGGCIHLAKIGQYYQVRKSTLLEDKSKTRRDANGNPIKYMYHSKHDIKVDYAWRRDIRKKLRKFGLGWLPPIIFTPWWLYIGVYNWDVMWKCKYDDVRYEFPPQFTIVFFGLCLTITLHEPTGNNKYTSDDAYWEGILNYLYKYNGNMYDTVYNCGVWSCGNESWFSIRPEHILRESDKQDYETATKSFKLNNNNEKII